MTKKHRRIQDGGNPAQGPPEVDEPITPSTDDDFPDTPPDNAADPRPGDE